MLLRKVCEECNLPVLSRVELKAVEGRNPTVIGEGAFGEALLNPQKNLVIKFSYNVKSFRNAIIEAKLLQLLHGIEFIQCLVGVCPDELALVTHYGGPTFKCLSGLSLEHKISIGLQIARAFASVHSAGFAHNDIKGDNICVNMTSAEPVVTIIDFGMAHVIGTAIRVPCSWQEDLPYAPEICLNKKVGRCSIQSDVYSIGQFLCQLFEGPKMPFGLRKWFFDSQKKSP
ncbi:casein kinase I-like [Penaeus indicus]|uniref:casein kinase I-like n=1 Tax=Penaeus indicus TaxID=29960 RepID=UPI00300D4B24